MISLLVCVLEYEIPRTGTKSLTCVSPGPGTVSTWLKAFPFLLEGKEKGYHPSTLLKLSLVSPLRAERGLQTGAVTVRLHRARSLCWKGSRQGIQGSWRDGTQELALYMTRTDCPGDAHSIHSALCPCSGEVGSRMATWETSEFLETWVRRRMLPGRATLGRCRRDTRAPKASPHSEWPALPSCAWRFPAAYSVRWWAQIHCWHLFLFHHVSPLGKRCRVFVDRKNRKSHIHKGDQI